jgi:hypothetical protein
MRTPVDEFARGSELGSPADEPESTGLLLCRDLIFTSKITGTAADLGYRILVADDPKLVKSMIESHRPRIVFVDLTAGDLVAPAALTAYQRFAPPWTWFVAFGPHVEGRLLAEAKAAGCHVVLPRSRFAAKLPEFIRQYFCEPCSRAPDNGL